MTPTTLLQCGPVAGLLRSLASAEGQFCSVQLPDFRGSASRYEELALPPQHDPVVVGPRYTVVTIPPVIPRGTT